MTEDECSAQVAALTAKVAELEAALSEQVERAAAVVRDGDERFRALVEGAFEGLAIQVDGKIAEANEAFVRHSGHASRQDLIGRSVLEFAAPESHATLVDHIRRGDETPYEVTAVRADGSTFVAELLGRNITYRGRPARITALRDLSERRRGEVERRELEGQLREARRLESLGIIAGGIAHDFNNLLAVVLGHADLALRQVKAETAAFESVSEIRNAATQAAELTKQMLLCGGRVGGRMVPVDLGALARESAELLRRALRGNVQLVFDLGTDVPLIEGDRKQLRQILINLVTNASDAIGDGHGEIRIRTSAVVHHGNELRAANFDATPGPGSRAILEVEDTGCGMNAETQGQAFDPFFSTKFAGRGLGLASVVGVVRAHRGAVSVASTPSLGSRFSVFFPAAAPSGPRAERGARKVNALPQENFALVADDEPMLRNLISEILGSQGFRVVTAKDGAEAQELLRLHHRELSLALLDFTMPKATGAQVLRQIREANTSLPVLIMSGYADSCTRPDPRDHRTAFVAKPFQETALLEAIRELLHSSSSHPPPS